MTENKHTVNVSRYGFVLAAIFVVGIGFWQVRRTASEAEASQRDALLMKASMIAEMVTPEQLKHLSFSPEDKRRPVFNRLCSQMRAASEHLGVAGIYTIIQRGGSFIFGPESYPENHPFASPPGTLYRQPPPELRKAFTLHTPQTTRPYRDEYGHFISALVPICSPRTEETMLVVGIDIHADIWQASVSRARTVPLLATLLLLATILASYLALAHRHRLPSSAKGRLHYLEPALCAAVMLALTVAATGHITAAERKTRLSTFTALARTQAASLADELLDIRTGLEDIKRFFLSCNTVDSHEFQLFTSRISHDSLVYAHIWAPAVPAPDAAAFEWSARHQGMKDFSMWQFEAGHHTPAPVSGRDTYYPILYIEPQDSHTYKRGFDLSSHPRSRAAIETAFRDGLEASTDAFTLCDIAGQPKGILFVIPVSTPFHKGIIASAVNLETLIRKPLYAEGALAEGLITELFQLEADHPPIHLASTAHDDGSPSTGRRPQKAPSLVVKTPVFCLDKTYTITTRASPKWLAQHPLREGRITALAGLLLTVLLTAFVAFLSNRRVVLEREIQSRTSDLQLMHDNVRAVLNAAPSAMLVVNDKAQLVDVNQSSHKLFGNQMRFAAGCRLGDYMGCVHGNDASGCGNSPFCPVCPINQAVRSALAGASGVHAQKTSMIINRSGTPEEVWLRFSVVPIRFNNSAHALVALYEITAWHRADEALVHERNLLYALMDNLPDRIYFKNNELKYIKVSKAQATALGLAAPEEAIGKTDADFLPPEEATCRQAKESEIIFTGQPLIAQIEQKQAEDGKTCWVSASKVPIRNKTGDIIGLVCISRDITIEIELQQQLQQASKMDAIGRLAGGVAHDFNNLLQAILGFTEILLAGVEESNPQYEDLKQIERAAKRASDLTRQLLTFSRKQRIDPQFIDLNQLISSTEKMLSRLMGEDITIALSLDPETKPILADPNQIEQIIMNLAVNARDAMPHGGRLTFSTSTIELKNIDTQMIPEASPGVFICLSVSDTGVGIQKQHLPHLFEPFFTTKAQGKGTGLGLAVIYGIVKQAGGWINVYSEDNKGATFKIFLPAQSNLVQNATPPPQTIVSMSLPGLGKNILLVEDETGIRSLVSLILQSAGYRVSACESAAEALSTFEKQKGRFDLLFSDIVLGGKNGIELACELRLKKPDMPVILSSGYADERVRWEQIEKEGFCFLAKPYPSQKLLQAIHETLSASAPRQVST